MRRITCNVIVFIHEIIFRMNVSGFFRPSAKKSYKNKMLLDDVRFPINEY